MKNLLQQITARILNKLNAPMFSKRHRHEETLTYRILDTTRVNQIRWALNNK